jgi:hypothetical protein
MKEIDNLQSKTAEKLMKDLSLYLKLMVTRHIQGLRSLFINLSVEEIPNSKEGQFNLRWA